VSGNRVVTNAIHYLPSSKPLLLEPLLPSAHVERRGARRIIIMALPARQSLSSIAAIGDLYVAPSAFPRCRSPFAVAFRRINRLRNQFGIALDELWFDLRHIAQFGFVDAGIAGMESPRRQLASRWSARLVPS
jgi:hypothetical protein